MQTAKTNYLKKCYLFFKKHYESFYYRKYFLSIRELPAINWIELNRTGDLKQLSRTGKICKRATDVFESIKNQVIDEFGVSEEFLRVHRANINLELLECEMLHTGDRTIQFHIEMEQKAIEDFLKPLIADGKKNDLYDAMIWIKKQQIAFDENEVSTFWFLKYMDHLMKEVKKNVKKNTYVGK